MSIRSPWLLALLLAVGWPSVGRTQDQSCPDATDTPAILAEYVGVAYRALATDPGRPLPPACLLTAVARSASSFRDSIVQQSLVLDSLLLRRAPSEPSLLDARLFFEFRLRHLAEVKPSFDRLVAIDPSRATLDRYRIAITSTELSADTAGALALLSVAAAKFPRASYIKSEYDLLREAPRMRALIDTVHREMIADPRKTGGLTSLASIYGNLGQTDSAIAYVDRGRAAKVPRAELIGAIRAIIGGVLRRAQLQDSPEEWEAALPAAFDFDSAFAINETKYFVAVAITHVIGERMDLVNFYRPTLHLTHGHGSFDSIDVTRPPQARADDACESMKVMLALIDYANGRMSAGGQLFSPETTGTIANSLAALGARLTSLSRGCR